MGVIQGRIGAHAPRRPWPASSGLDGLRSCWGPLVVGRRYFGVTAGRAGFGRRRPCRLPLPGPTYWRMMALLFAMRWSISRRTRCLALGVAIGVGRLYRPGEHFAGPVVVGDRFIQVAAVGLGFRVGMQRASQLRVRGRLGHLAAGEFLDRIGLFPHPRQLVGAAWRRPLQDRRGHVEHHLGARWLITGATLVVARYMWPRSPRVRRARNHCAAPRSENVGADRSRAFDELSVSGDYDDAGVGLGDGDDGVVALAVGMNNLGAVSVALSVPSRACPRTREPRVAPTAADARSPALVRRSVVQHRAGLATNQSA